MDKIKLPVDFSDSIINRNRQIIRSTNNSPLIDYNPLASTLTIKGNCKTTAINEFFDFLVNILQQHFREESKLTLYLFLQKVHLEAITSSSTLFQLLHSIRKKDKKIEIFWFHEQNETELLEIGRELQRVFSIPVNLMPV